MSIEFSDKLNIYFARTAYLAESTKTIFKEPSTGWGDSIGRIASIACRVFLVPLAIVTDLFSIPISYFLCRDIEKASLQIGDSIEDAMESAARQLKVGLACLTIGSLALAAFGIRIGRWVSA